jgi:acyl-coenzyme A thioesterase PaaI-like protein
MGNVIGQELPAYGATFTAKLTVEYKRPVGTPGTVMARAWIVAVEGRKVWVEGVVEDGEGNVHARGEGLWLRGKGKGKL